MEKLIELLNEYEYSRFEDKSLTTERGDIQDWVVFEKDFCQNLDKPREMTMNVTHLISARYGFIKRLVENDKIDQTAIEGNFGYFCMEGFDNTESLIMVLSISDTPIDDLILYLK